MNKSRAINVYTQKMFRIIVIVCPLFTLFAGIIFSSLKAAGFYPDVSAGWLTVFDITCLIYTLIGIFTGVRCVDSSGQVKGSYYNFGKWFLLVSLLIQWNFISYLFPVSEFWAYAPFFLTAIVFFLDLKLVAADIAGLLLSIFISWIIKPETLLPYGSPHFTADVVIRVICLVFSMCALFVVTFITKKICFTDVTNLLVGEAEREALVDELTGLNNRRAYFSNQNKFKNTEKTGVIFADVNGLKYTNDHHGHTAGDSLICEFAGILKRFFRADDLYRVSGDEFIVLCFNIEKDLFEQKVRSLTHVLDSQEEPVASFGSVYGGENLQEMVNHAEHLMYDNKQEYHRRFPEKER